MKKVNELRQKDHELIIKQTQIVNLKRELNAVRQQLVTTLRELNSANLELLETYEEYTDTLEEVVQVHTNEEQTLLKQRQTIKYILVIQERITPKMVKILVVK